MESFYNNRFDGIQMLRGVAAFSVLLNHISYIGNGAFGVDIFFCISGFIMMYVTEKSTDRFIVKRIIRIVPLYYLMTIFTYVCSLVIPQLFEKTKMEPVYLVKSLLFIPFDIGNLVQPIVRVGWTLNYEVFFYVLLWIALHISHKYRGLIASGMIICLVISGLVFDMRELPGAIGVPLGFWSDSIMMEFIFGMLAFEILKNISEKIHISNFLLCIMVIVAISCYIFMWFMRYSVLSDDVPRFILNGIPAFIIFMVVFIVTYGKKLPALPVLLGDISYSVYLIHYFIVRLFNHYVCPDGMADIRVICLTIILVALITLISIASYNLIELKASKYLRRKLLPFFHK